MKDELGWKIMTEFAALKLKPQCYLTHDNNKNKKAKGTEKCVIKRNLNLKIIKKCLETINEKKK